MGGQGTHYLYHLGSKIDKVQNPEKVTKTNFRNIPKAHAYLQTMTKISVKFPIDPSTTVGRVACTRYLLSELGIMGLWNYGKPNTMYPHFSSKRRKGDGGVGDNKAVSQ